MPRPVSWFGLFDVPPLPIGKAAAGFGHEAHEILGWAMLVLVAIHVAAALRHHFLLRDGVLTRMSFRRGEPVCGLADRNDLPIAKGTACRRASELA